MNDMPKITEGADIIFSMEMLNPNSPLPLYHQIFENLSRRIHSGELPNGYKLPSEKDLASHLSVSRITVKRALNELAATGLVSRKRGRGTQVTMNTALVVRGGVIDMKSNIAAMRKNAKAKLIERRQTNIPEYVRNMLKLSADEAIEMIKHSLFLADGPVTLTTTYAPAALMQSYTKAEIERESIIMLMEADDIHLSQADQTISAVVASKDQAEAFDIPIKSPLLEIQCLMRDQRGKPCQFVTSYFQPEFYRYEMTLM